MADAAIGQVETFDAGQDLIRQTWNGWVELFLDTSEVDFPMFRLQSKHTGPIVVDVLYVGVDGIVVSMEVDTGAAVSVMSLKQQQVLFLQPAGDGSNPRLLLLLSQSLQKAEKSLQGLP